MCVRMKQKVTFEFCLNSKLSKKEVCLYYYKRHYSEREQVLQFLLQGDPTYYARGRNCPKYLTIEKEKN